MRAVPAKLCAAVLVVGAIFFAEFTAAQESAESPDSPAVEQSAAAAAPLRLDGAEAYAFRKDPQELYLYVCKPKDWKPGDKRPAFIWYFGGGFLRGSPEKSVGTARWAAKHGMVGIAPDYRVKERYPLNKITDIFSDGRLAVRWVQENAELLGVDPTRVVVGGNSAGGGLALTTGLSYTPPGASAEDAPLYKPAALILNSAVSDTSMATGYGGSRLGGKEIADGVSPLQHLDEKMPPVLAFHGDADKTVPYKQAVALHEKLTATGNLSELITIPGGSHSYSSDFPEWKDKSREAMLKFLRERGLVATGTK